MKRLAKSRTRELIESGQLALGTRVSAKLMQNAQSSNACVHRGDVVRTEQCASCGGNVQVKIHACAIHSECTLSSKNSTVKLCTTCPDKESLTLRTYPPILNAAKESSKVAQPPIGFRGRGIVIVAGGVKYFPSAYVLVRLLRYLGCNLPIEWWYFGKYEMDTHMTQIAQKLGNVSCRDLESLQPRPAGGWQAKISAIRHSEFAEVLFLDADQIPADDPTYLFETPEYLETGAVFWEDLAPLGWDIRADAFTLCGLPVPGRTTKPDWRNPTDYRPFETGQLLVDKTKHWPALTLCQHLNDYSDIWYPSSNRDQWLIYGDKSTFYLAWEMLKSPYAMPPGPGWTGGRHGGAFLQKDFDGDLIFAHRTQPPSKLSIDPANNQFTPQIPHSELVQQYIEELRQEWHGGIIPSSIPAAHHALASRLIGSRWLFGLNGVHREITIQQHGRTSDLEIGWTIQDSAEAVLVIKGREWSVSLGRDNYCNWVNHGQKAFLQPIPLEIDYLSDSQTLSVVNDLWTSNEYRLPETLNGSILDIGGHIGTFALCCLTRGADRTLSVEPSHRNFTALVHNLSKHQSKASCLLGTAWSYRTTAVLGQPPGAEHTGGWSAVHPHKDAISSPAWSINDLIQLVGHVALLKLDCEGAEWELLSTADLDAVEAICGEYHLAPIERGEVSSSYGLEWLRSKLESNGFRLHTHPTLSNLGLFWAARPTSQFYSVWK